MPTAAKLVAALILAALGFIVSEQIKTLYSEGTVFGVFSYVNLVIGLLCGWIIVGKRAGRGFSAAIGNGLTGVAALVFWGLFVQGANTMVAEAMRNRYNGPVEAFAAVFELIGEYIGTMNDQTVIVTLVGGALVVGILSEMAARAWR